MLNLSGNVGKTLLAKHLLQPRLKLDYFYVGEFDIIDNQRQYDKMRAEAFSYVHDCVLIEPELVLDVDSTETSLFLDNLSVYQGCHNDYDYFIIPATSAFQAMRKTEKTLERLLKIGVPTRKIRLLFNQTHHVSENAIHIEFDYLIKAAQRLGIVVPKIAVQFNEVYAMLEKYQKPLSDLVNDNNLTCDQSPSSTSSWQTASLMKRLAVKAERNLDKVFIELSLREQAVVY